ncbi:related to exopolyphosphatase [Rhynchosporium secalis]|uniref:Related to exopolyphosphatase n=1 Tax=Rhynchosporium secalis TaxID=38038 RepID=A0A1E1M8H0_RHYSE|nr:related to exopolyphosphatase [Rhynchosporium secalis]
MPLPRVSLRSFLSTAKTALHNAKDHQSSPLTFVIGNEASGSFPLLSWEAHIHKLTVIPDLDSLCSAVVLAYLRTYASTSDTNTLYIPLSNIPHADLALRPELLPVLSRANLKPSDLITLNDLPNISPAVDFPPEKTKWILVDHNSLLGELGRVYSSRVVGCIDHHDEENKVPKDCGDEPRIVRKSGSCSSLVVEYCREAWDALSDKSNDQETAKWNAQLARLALGPVLIDTSYLQNEAKTTPTDVEAANYLEKWITAGEVETYDGESYYMEIWTAERDVEGLSLMDLLRKDYKQWNEGGVNLGTSSVVKGIDFLLSKTETQEEFFDTLRKFSEERNLSICSIMTRFSPKGGDGFGRELFVWGFDDKGMKAVKKFEAQSSNSLGLKIWKDGALDSVEKGVWRKCWDQRKLENSRKQVAPMLRLSMSD